MFKCFKRFFTKPKKMNNTQNAFITANPKDYEGLSKADIVLKGCQEFEVLSNTFTSKMIYKYLVGIIDYDSTLKSIHYLVKKGKIKKVTILASDNEGFKHKLFYALNK